jgi:hypothetical protein
MKIAWAAMAAATMLAIAALLWDFFGRPAAPFLAATGPWPSSLCDRPPNAARGAGRAVPGYRLYFEGMSRLVGGCHPADPAAGVAAIERAFAQGLPAAFAISFVDALATSGRRGDLERWLGVAAIAVIDWRFHGFDTFGVPVAATPELRAGIARLRDVFARADTVELANEIETALNRSGDVAVQRRLVDAGLIPRLFQVDPAAANYWRYRVYSLNGEPPFMFGGLQPNLYFAQLCKHPPAIAEAVQLYVDAKSDPSDAHIVIGTILSARDRGDDVADLIVGIATRFETELKILDEPEARKLYDLWADEACPKSLANQRRHFEVPPPWSAR